jgi:hypothetical protein
MARLAWPLLAALSLASAAPAAAQTTQPLQSENPPFNPLLGLSSIFLQRDDPASPGVEVTPASRGLSFELVQAFRNEGTPFPPSLRLKQGRLSQEELGVVVWLNAHRDEIAAEEALFHVPRQAIAGVIAWEALENVVPFSPRSVGPGKVHICNMSRADCLAALILLCSPNCPQDLTAIDNTETVAEEVESMGLLPRRSLQQRIDLLKTSAGSIRYIAAILRAGADAAKDAGWDIDNDPAMLATFYRGYTVRRWRNLLRTVDRTGPRLIFRDRDGGERIDPMGAWIVRNSVLLADGVGASAMTTSSGSFLSDVARDAANQPDIRSAREARERELRQPDTRLEEAERAEARAAAWEYVRATMQLACTDPDSLQSLRAQRRIWGVRIARETVTTFVARDRAGMSPCALRLVDAMLRSYGPVDIGWIEREGRRDFDAEQRRQRAEREAREREERAARAEEERKQARDSYQRAEGRLSTRSDTSSSAGSGRTGPAYGQAVGIAGGAMGIFDGR